MDCFRYWMPTEIVFGAGLIESLAARSENLGKKPLLVTGRRSARATGALGRVMAQLPNAAVFDGVGENPTTETCERGAAFCRENGCDLIVALGGGSAMDAGKAIAGLVLNPGKCSDFFGADKFINGNLPIIAIPTTAGTGSEVTPYSVLINQDTRSKLTIAGRGLFPVTAILDPELSTSMPRAVTISTGLDALSQAMEGMASIRATPLGDSLALDTCRIVHAWLPRAADCPGDLEARSEMLYAAMLSGCVIAQSGTTLIHGMGYYFTLEFGLPHGLANGLLLAPVFRYNAQHLPEKVAAMAAALGCPSEPTPGPAGDAIVQALYGLLNRLGVSSAARDAGVQPERLAWCADDLFADRPRFKNQRGNPTLGEVRSFFLAAYQGAIECQVGSS